MNDVVGYSTTFTTDKDNKLIAMKDVFTPLHSGGSLKSAGYQLDMPTTAVKNVTIDHFSSSAQTVGGLESNQSKAVIMLFDDIHRPAGPDHCRDWNWTEVFRWIKRRENPCIIPLFA